MLTTDRAVLLYYMRGGQRRRGSGLRVGGSFILTADHCAQGTDHVVVSCGGQYPATVHERSSDPAVDVAILDAPGLPDVDPLGCALVDRTVATQLRDVTALGYPIWKGPAPAPVLG